MIDYELDGKLDEGGYGEVFKAVSLNTGDTVVIKKQPVPTAEDLARVKREAEIHQKLNSEWVIGFIESFEEEGCFYIVLQFANRGNLLDYLLKNQKTITYIQKLRILE